MMLERMIRHPFAIIIGVLVVAIGGMVSFRALPVDLFPDLNYPLINIITHYPAGTSEDIEQLVTRPIENAMLGLNELRRVRSVSAPGFSQVTVEFNWGVDVLQARQLVDSRLSQSAGSLPPGARPELQNIGTSLAVLSTYVLTGGDPTALRSWAQYELAPRLGALPGIARVDVLGGGVSAWRIDLDPQRLLQHHLSSADITAAIRSENVLDTGGYLEQHGRDLLVRTEGRIRTPKDLENVVVARGPDGRPLRLGEVAKVYAGTMPERYVASSGRLPAVAFTIQKQPQASTLSVSQAVDAELAAIPLPPDAKLAKFYDQAEIIGLAYRNMRNNLLAGALFAVVALVAVLGLHRISLIVAVTIPLTMLGTFIAMRVIGFGVNLMTLGAMTVATGLLVDDAIIVLENIMRHRQKGLAPLAAVFSGTREIFGPDVAGTLTVLAAFLPLTLISGLAGRLFQPFGLIFTVLIALSLLFSLTVIPVVAAYWLPRKLPVGGQHRPTDHPRWLAWLAAGNRCALEWLLTHRATAIVGALVLFAGSVALLSLNPVRFLPLLDEDSLLLSYQLAPGTSLTESNRVGDELEALALTIPGVTGVYRRTGSPQESFYLEGPDQGELVIRLARNGSVDAVAAKRQLEGKLATLPGIITRINEPTTEKLDESFSGLPALFGITVYGNDLAALHTAAARIEDVAGQVEGMGNVVNNTKVPVNQVVVQIDRDAGARLGVDARTVAEAVRLAMQGDAVTDVIVNQRPIPLFLRYADAARGSASALADVLVRAKDGRAILLGQLARIQPMTGYPTIEHQHGTRALTMTAEIDGNPLTVIDRLNRAIAALHLPLGIQVAYTGEYRQLLDTLEQWLAVVALAALLVYGIVAVQLGSLLDPLIVLAKLPIDFMGAAVALFLTRQPVDLTVLIGAVTLIGVSVNNGITLLTFTRNLRREGLDAAAAVREAAALRFRPTLLSNLTAMLALIPAALGIGQGPQLLQPLGVMLFGGLTAGALLTLTLLPVLYVATERWRRPQAIKCMTSEETAS
jgi:CzcA family heavy metal efflux pump